MIKWAYTIASKAPIAYALSGLAINNAILFWKLHIFWSCGLMLVLFLMKNGLCLYQHQVFYQNVLSFKAAIF